MSVSVCLSPSVCDGSALDRGACREGEWSSRVMLATARPSCYPSEAVLHGRCGSRATPATTSPVRERREGRTQYLNFEVLGQSGSLSERTPRHIVISINHPYSSPCVVTAPAKERYATTRLHRPVLHVDWLFGGRRWPTSVLLGSLLDSDALASRATGWCVRSLWCVTERVHVRARLNMLSRRKRLALWWH